MTSNTTIFMALIFYYCLYFYDEEVDMKNNNSIFKKVINGFKIAGIIAAPLGVIFAVIKDFNISIVIKYVFIAAVLYFLCRIFYKLAACVKRLFKQYRSKNMLKSLSREYGGEVAVLKYVLDNPLGSVTWIPLDNAAVLSLNKNGILELMDFPSVTRKSWDKVNTICRPCVIPEYLRKYINAHRTELEEHWGDVLPYAELRHYQHN